MYGIKGYENDYDKLFDLNLLGNWQQEPSKQPEPQIMHGLLTPAGQKNNDLEAIIAKGAQTAEQLGQKAPIIQPTASDALAQREASMRQSGLQSMTQRQQQGAQNAQLALQIAKMFFMGGA